MVTTQVRLMSMFAFILCLILLLFLLLLFGFNLLGYRVPLDIAYSSGRSRQRFIQIHIGGFHLSRDTPLSALLEDKQARKTYCLQFALRKLPTFSVKFGCRNRVDRGKTESYYRITKVFIIATKTTANCLV